MAAINPYLTFDGNCEEAFTFYKSVFGGEFPGGIIRFNSAPSEIPRPESADDKVMHVALSIGNTFLMGSDRMESRGKGTIGDNVSISIIAQSEEEAKKLFEGLSAGGKVTMPLNKTFWNAYFGMFTDKFGIHWMVNYDYK